MHRLVSFRVQKNVRKAVDFLASTEDWQMPTDARMVWQVPGRCRRMPHDVASAWPPADAMGAGKCSTVLRKRPALFCRLQDLFQFLRR